MALKAKPTLMRSIACDLAIIGAAATLLQGILFWVILRDHTTAMPQMADRDVANFLAADVLNLFADGEDLHSAFDKAAANLIALRPAMSVLLTDNSGSVKHSAGNCVLTRHTVEPSLLAAFRGPFQPEFPVPYSPVCASGEELRSVAPIDLPEGPGFLVATSDDHLFSEYLHSSRGVLRFFGWLFPSVGFLGAWAFFAFRRFKASLAAQAEAMASRAQCFARGELSARFSPGDFPEFGSLATLFNGLADEISSRLEHLSENERRRQETMAALSHDLRTPMTAIEGSLMLLERSSLSARDRDEYLELIGMSAGVQQDFAKQMHDLSSLELRDQTLKVEPCALGGLLAEVRAQLRPVAEAQGVRLTTSAVEAGALVQADRELLKRALLNLLQNGLQHTPSGRTVRCEVVADSKHTSFFISDEGPGLVPDQPDEVTPGADSTYQASKKRKGLGLVIVQRIAALHNGELSVLKTGPQGTTFQLRIPTEAADPISEQTEPLPSAIVRKSPDRFSRMLTVAFVPFAAGAGLTAIPFAGSVIERAEAFVLPLIAFALTRRSRGNRAVLGVCLCCLLTLVYSGEGNYARNCLAGAAVAIGAATLLGQQVLSRGVGLVSYVAVAALPPLWTMPSPWQYLTGVLGGLWVVGVLAIIEFVPSGRRAAIWFSGLISLGAGIAVFINAASLYLFAVTTPEAVIAGSVENVFDQASARLSKSKGSAAERNLELARISFLEPMLDLAVFDSAGKLLANGGYHSADAEQAEVGSAFRSGQAPASGTSVRVSLHRRYEFRGACDQPECEIFAMGIPADLVDALVQREMTSSAVLLVLAQLFIATPAISIVGRRWNSLLRARMGEFPLMLEQLRNGAESPQALATYSDEFAPLTLALKEVLTRIPELEERLRRQGVFQERFLRGSSESISGAARALRLAATVPTLENRELRTLAGNVRHRIDEIFQLSYLDRGEFRVTLEDFSLIELIIEEVEKRRRISNVRIHLEESSLDDLCIAHASSEIVGEAIRYLLEVATARTPAGGELRARFTAGGEHYSIEIADSGAVLSAAALALLFHPFDSPEPSSALREELSDFSGFTMFRIAQALALFGARLEAKSSVSTGMKFLLRLPRTTAPVR